jgi:hypothetical protein
MQSNFDPLGNEHEIMQERQKSLTKSVAMSALDKTPVKIYDLTQILVVNMVLCTSVNLHILIVSIFDTSRPI